MHYSLFYHNSLNKNPPLAEARGGVRKTYPTDNSIKKQVPLPLPSDSAQILPLWALII